MPHLGAAAINRWLSGSSGNQNTSNILNSYQTSIIRPALEADSIGMLYSASITFLDAIRGMQGGYFSWSIVKLYYSSFYSVRALLGGHLIAIFYLPGKGTPYSLHVVDGNSPRREKGTTHKVVWKILERDLPNNPVMGTIDNNVAHEWLMALREDANYRTPKFPDPSVPNYFSEIDKNGLVNTLNIYANDKSNLYAFDKDHASVAYPLECLRHSRKALANLSLKLEDDDEEYLSSCLESLKISNEFFIKL